MSYSRWYTRASRAQDPRGTCRFCGGPILLIHRRSSTWIALDPVEIEPAPGTFAVMRNAGACFAIPYEETIRQPPAAFRAHRCREGTEAYIERRYSVLHVDPRDWRRE